MINTNSGLTNRTKLVDQPIVEMILSKRYCKNGIKFQQSYNDNSFNYTINSLNRSIHIIRNSCKYYNSHNYSISLNLNKLNIFNNSSFIFIDELVNTMYIVDGMNLLAYIIEKANNIQSDKDDTSKHFILIPKNDIVNLTKDNINNVIKYNKQIASIFALNRDELKYQHLV